MTPIPLTETQMAELFRLRAENAALKDQIKQLRIEADFNFEQYQDAGRLMFELKEITEQQAEAIRLKDAALDWCIGEFNLRLDDIDLSQETIRVLSARHIQPSPEILQARDERVAKACMNSVTWECAIQISSGEWRKYL